VSETDLHRDLVALLLSHISGSCVITHVAGRSEFPDPYAIGRHEPDVIAEANGVIIIGEAKIGPDLEEARAAEQIADFSAARGQNGEKATFWLCVPEDWRSTALDSIAAHGDPHYRTDVLGVVLPS
jgi:hypothetical protein